MSSSLSISVFRSTQIRGLQQSVRGRFVKGSLGADPWLINGEHFSLSERRKTMERVEELSVLF